MFQPGEDMMLRMESYHVVKSFPENFGNVVIFLVLSDVVLVIFTNCVSKLESDVIALGSDLVC